MHSFRAKIQLVLVIVHNIFRRIELMIILYTEGKKDLRVKLFIHLQLRISRFFGRQQCSVAEKDIAKMEHKIKKDVSLLPATNLWQKS